MNGTLLKTQLDSSVVKRSKPGNRRRNYQTEDCRLGDWVDMVTAMRVETSPPSRESEVCYHLRQQTRENESSDDEEARGHVRRERVRE